MLLGNLKSLIKCILHKFWKYILLDTMGGGSGGCNPIHNCRGSVCSGGPHQGEESFLQGTEGGPNFGWNPTSCPTSLPPSLSSSSIIFCRRGNSGVHRCGGEIYTITSTISTVCRVPSLLATGDETPTDNCWQVRNFRQLSLVTCTQMKREDEK